MSLMTAPVIRIAGAADAPALAALRRAWTVEQYGEADDEGFEARFLDWFERESARRVTWVAEVPGAVVGMVNLAAFDRMPGPGWDACLDRLAGLPGDNDAWPRRFAVYSAQFEPVIGPQEGPPAGYKGDH